MSTKDKAREKLLGSMRKTKEVIEDQPDTKQAHAETYTPPARKTTSAKRPTKTAASQIESAIDPYQSKGRIWPD